jgi:general secretion pathway protein B
MSYILDALRKSEQERQKTTGQGISLSYPITVKHESESRLIPVLLGIAAILAAIAVWWSMSGTDNRPAPTPPVATPPIATAPLPQPVVAEIAAKEISKPPQHTDGIRSKRVVKASPKQPPAKSEAPAPAAATDNPANDPLKGMPPLEVTGFIHNEQGGNMAIINDRLMKEGDEVSPGLRVEKIKEDAVIFNYKGYVFSR